MFSTTLTEESNVNELINRNECTEHSKKGSASRKLTNPNDSETVQSSSCIESDHLLDSVAQLTNITESHTLCVLREDTVTESGKEVMQIGKTTEEKSLGSGQHEALFTQENPHMIQTRHEPYKCTNILCYPSLLNVSDFHGVIFLKKIVRVSWIE